VLARGAAELLGGGGGGKDDLAQGGGTDPSKVSEALGSVEEALHARAA
jgi:alanyl-tRNA synthetase